MKLKIYNTSGNPLPEYKSEGAAAMDIASAIDTRIHPSSIGRIGTGLYIGIPKGYELQVRSRSGLAANKQVFVLNSPGTIDSDYKGEIIVLLFNIGTNFIDINKGDRIAQIILSPITPIQWKPVEYIDEIGSSSRGILGFGSTDSK